MKNIYSAIALGLFISCSVSTASDKETRPNTTEVVRSVLFNKASKLSVPDKIKYLDNNGFTADESQRYSRCITHRSMDGYEKNGFFARRHIRFFKTCLRPSS